MSNLEEELVDSTSSSIAIIGIAGRFPGARNVEEYWDNVCQGRESITFFSDEELRAAGVDEAYLKKPIYVKAASMLDDVESFDAAFFGYNPREAELMDPQQRLFLECAWEVFESAGYDPHKYDGLIGIYAGASMSNYLLYNLYPNRALADPAVFLQASIGNNLFPLTSRVSYKLNLRGPSISIQTACSTSLVAVHLACQSLLNDECDMALAGGVSVLVPQKTGYHYQDDSLLSPDGHCRAFDAAARGTIFGSGLGIVLLKRLAEAIADGDQIRAVIRGSAINNDGALKVGYTAPSVSAQAEVVIEAMATAGVTASEIGYVECHGTGTALGDPIEIAALTKAFAALGGAARQSCAIGSVKSNIGHLDTAAGVAGLIKAVLMVERGQLPASLHYEQPNPQIDFVGSPFAVNTQLREWERQGEQKRRAGVSSFGMGGTNAHVVIEEGPRREEVGTAAGAEEQEWQLLLLSARTEAGVARAAQQLAAHLRTHKEMSLADVAYTTQVGRQAMRYRRAVVCRTVTEAARELESVQPANEAGNLSASDITRATQILKLLAQEHHGLRRSQETEMLARELDQLWTSGVEIDWAALHAGRSRRRVQLPTYPFERVRYWIDPPSQPTSTVANEAPDKKTERYLRPSLSSVYVAPRNDIEQRLTEIWQELLAIEPIGVNDNLVELGGDSLTATQILSRLREKFEIGLSLRAIFDNPTVAELAERIESSRQSQPVSPTQPIARIPRDGELPLSFAQQRLWFLDQFDPNSALYNISTSLLLSGTLEVEALRRGLNEMARRHEALRTAFLTVDGEPRQVISEAVEVPFEIDDLSKLEEPERTAAAQRLAAAEAATAFDLGRAPLVRARLLRLAAAEQMLIVVFHHIVSDGWSLGVFVRELGALYEAYRSGQESPLAELELQYADYAQWQRERLRGAELGVELEYWRERLGGAQEPLALATDRVRPSVPQYAGATQTWALGRELTERLRELSRSQEATLFMTLLAGLQTLLWRYTGQEEISVGTPVAGRLRSETEGLIGFFVNTLVLRTELQGAPSFVELLGRVREVCLGAYQHQELPFEQLVQALQPEREVSRTPLFQVMLVLQNTPHVEIELERLRLKPVNLDTGTAKFELTLFIHETADGALGGLLEYQTELFHADTAARFINHYARLLAWVVANPERSITEAEILDQAERQRLLVEWNETGSTYATSEACLPELFEDQVRRTPDRIAATWGDAHTTYAQLNSEANQLAHYLRGLGVGPESCVGVLIERSLDMAVGLLGVLKAGGCYVPLDPAYPANRLAFMIQDAGVELVLTQQTLREIVPATVRAICLDTEKATLAAEADTDPESGVIPDNLLYVIYTSGSTGLPKGVAMTHRAISNLIAWQLEHSPLAGDDAKTLQFTALSFDVSIQEIFSTWCAGGELEIVSEETRRDPVAVLRLISEKEVRRIFLPFVALQQLAEAASAFHLVPQGLREVITAGEQLQITPQVASLFEALPECTLHNQYGPSESHVVSAYTLVGAIPSWPTLPPIGKPVSNTQLFILDERLDPVPTGVVGQLYLGGVALARGYLARPEVTAERFIPHPFSDQPGVRLYHTGDLSRWLPNGDVEFLGRADQQVKIRGFRVELGEIESVLSRHPAVDEAVVVSRSGGPGGNQLVAYVIGKPGADSGFTELRGFLRERLPDYMVPSVVVPLEAFPLTPSGKVDRRRLPEPDGDRPGLENVYVEPETEAQRKVADIWRDALRLERVGINDNFFDLGGHSLLMVQVNSKLRVAFDCDISLVEMFKYSTVASLAEHLTRKETVPTSFTSSYQRAETRKQLRRRHNALRQVQVQN